MVYEKGHQIQAFPIGRATENFPSGVTSLEPNKMGVKVLRVLTDGATVEFNLGKGTVVLDNVAAGTDFAIGEEVISFTTTAAIWVG